MPLKFATLGALMAVAMLAGCSTTSESAKGPVAAEAGSGRCDATAAEFTLGKKASPQLLEEARTRSGSQSARILRPNDMITLEYRSERLNLNVDEQGNVVRVNCG